MSADLFKDDTFAGGADTSGLGPNTNFRIISGVLQIWDVGISQWREVWFDNGQLQVGGGIAP